MEKDMAVGSTNGRQDIDTLESMLRMQEKDLVTLSILMDPNTKVLHLN